MLRYRFGIFKAMVTEYIGGGRLPALLDLSASGINAAVLTSMSLTRRHSPGVASGVQSTTCRNGEMPIKNSSASHVRATSNVAVVKR